MKKLIIAGVTTALLLTAGTAAFAANEANDAAKNNAAATTTPGYHQFVDKNNDGICDDWETYHKDGNSYCQNNGYRHHRNGGGHCWNYNNGNNNSNNSGNAVPQANMMSGYGHHGRSLNI